MGDCHSGVGCCFVRMSGLRGYHGGYPLPSVHASKGKSKAIGVHSNQRQIALAMQMYIVDSDSFLPIASQWTDKVKLYLPSGYLFHCPSLVGEPLKCGYAFYRPLSGRKVTTIAQPATTPMLFDSSQGQFNYADEGQSLDLRHLKGAVISFVDGHVR